MTLMTPPKICGENGLSLDILRPMLRNDPSLRGLGVRVGCAKAYTPEELRKIIDAYRQREARLGRTPAPVAGR